MSIQKENFYLKIMVPIWHLVFKLFFNQFKKSLVLRMHAFLTEIIVNVIQYTQSHVLRFILQSYPNFCLS